ncbi:endonuclease [Methylobacterium hispanicum]|uniref:endonuclease n=1 Tax=Methylobacterium hispanicum TaxID=270350 RepID=UPI002F301FC2
MLHRFCATAALLLFTVTVHADEAELLAGRLYAADALPGRITGRIEEVFLVEVPASASHQPREDLHLRLAVFKIWPGEAVERPELRGTIARAALYADGRYGWQLTEAERHRYLAWHREYPPSPWEGDWNAKAACAQHDTGNPYIGQADACQLGQPAMSLLDRLMQRLR